MKKWDMDETYYVRTQLAKLSIKSNSQPTYTIILYQYRLQSESYTYHACMYLCPLA